MKSYSLPLAIIAASTVFATQSAFANPVVLDFETDGGEVDGGIVGDGLLTLTDGGAELELGSLDAVEFELELRKVDAGALVLSLGDQSWVADYTDGGGLRMDNQVAPLPHDHRSWQTDSAAVFSSSDGSTGPWSDGSVLHCDVFYDDTTATWYLYYTGEQTPGYGYRQIGVLTSPDGETWTEYANNPVLTIDYDLTTVDGVHVHMPTVAIDPAAGDWHMYYSCYQNGVGNRICHATSPDGLDWTPKGVVLDRGASGEFDSASLREPDVQIGSDGTWHMFYQGTKDDEHYGPTAYATSPDGENWTKHGEVPGSGVDVLQGGGTWLTDDLWEQWYNCEDAFCYAWADPSDAMAWTVDSEPVLTKNWATWNSGYIQAPTPWLVDGTFHMWFNGYDYGTGFESLGHARTVPEPGEWAVLALSWDGATLSVSMDGGQVLEAAATGVEGLGLLSTGTVEIQTLSYTATESADDTGVDTGTDTSEDTGDDTGSTGGGDTVDTSSDTGDGGAVEPDTDGGCGCGVGTGTSANFATLLVLGGLMVRRRRRSNGDI